MILRHIQLPRLTPYAHASALQDRLVSALLAHKANPAESSPPEPAVITAQFNPVYTCGRREIGTISDQQRAYLTQESDLGKADFHEALRGGQTTFHGPGQLVAYPILDLRRHRLTPRDYIRLLESTVMQTCSAYGVNTLRTANPGVWVSEQDKVCAVGVHLRRNVSSHGIGLNVSTNLSWFERIVACGLEGKGTTSFEKEGVKPVPHVETVADVFVMALAKSLDGVQGVARIDERSVS